MAAQSTATVHVHDVMTARPITVGPATTAREFARILAENGISGTPVINENDRLIGVATRTDLMQWCVSGGLGFRDDDLYATLTEDRTVGLDVSAEDLGTVEDFMSTEPITARPDEELRAVATRMAEERVHRVVVVDEHDAVVGVLTSLDVVKALAAPAGSEQPAPPL